MALRNGLVSYWKLDEASGTRVDSQGSNNLTENGTVTNNTGIISSAAQFNGTATNYLSKASVSGMAAGAGDFTFVCWFQVNDNTIANDLCHKGFDSGGTTNPDWWITVQADVVFFFAAATGITANATTPASSVSAATWYFLVVQVDTGAGQIKISLNNGAFSTASWSTPFDDVTNEFSLGTIQALADTDANPFAGLIDEAAYFSRLLTAGELTALYNSGAGFAGPGFGYALNFSVQPSNTAAGVSMSPSPAIEILDETSTRDTGATDSITLAIGTNPSGGTLSTGTNPKNASSGLATFNTTSINIAGNGYTLTGAATNITGATSNSFNITGAAAASSGGTLCLMGVG